MWETKALTHCDGDKYGRYETILEAKQACVKDSNCGAIYDNSCDNQDFSLCRLGYTEKSSSSSCLYIKPGGIVIMKL